jgi:hypothetical protein
LKVLTLKKKFILVVNIFFKIIKINVFSSKNKKLSYSSFRKVYTNSLLKSFAFLLIFTTTQCNKPYFWETNNEPNQKPSKTDESQISKEKYLFITKSIGESKVKHNDKTEEKGSAGIFLYEGDKITTEKNSFLDLQFSDESMVRIYPDSSVSLDTIQTQGKSKKVSISLSNGMIYSKTFSSSETNKLSIHTPILTTVSSGAEWILSFIGNQSLAKVKFGKVIVYPRAKSLEDKDPMDIKTESNVGKIAVAVSEKMLLLEAMQEFFLPYYPNFLLEASKIESIPNYTKWISDLNVQSKPTKFSTTEIGIFNSIALLDKKLIGELYTINQELQNEIKDPKKMEDLEAKRSLLENQLLKSATPEEAIKISLPPIFIKPKYAISRSISRRLSYYKRKGLYKRQSKRVLTSESEIYNYYERLEKLLLTNDRIEIGTIISQDSSLIILHTEDGIKRIPAEEVLEVTYDYYKPRP